LRSEVLTTGPVNLAFEAKLTELVDAKYAISCSSGTAALHLAVQAIGLKAGDKVVVPTITFLATANAPRYTGADVLFADVEPDTGLMGAGQLEEVIYKIEDKVAAVIPVHLGGQSPNLAEISRLARRHKIAIIEDASHAIGSVYAGSEKNNLVGSCGDSQITTFSFHPAKNIAMGEGGAVTTNDERLAHRLRLLRNHGMVREEHYPDPWFYQMRELGFNYRASDIHCALGLSQLNKLPNFSEKRRRLVESYDLKLGTLAPVVRSVRRMPGNPVWHLYIVLIDFSQIEIDRATVMNRLLAAGIGSQVHYIPVHQQPYYKELYGEMNMPGAEQYYRRCLSLPLYTRMEEKDVQYVVETLGNIIGL